MLVLGAISVRPHRCSCARHLRCSRDTPGVARPSGDSCICFDDDDDDDDDDGDDEGGSSDDDDMDASITAALACFTMLASGTDTNSFLCA